MKQIQGVIGILVAVSSIALSPFASGAGFAIMEQSASGLGNAFAGGSAGAEDASTVFFNPAGMMRLDKQVLAAAHLIMPKARFNNEGSSQASSLGGGSLSGPEDDGGADKFVPNFYLVYPMNSDFRLGVGFNAPFGLATQYDDTWVGRYHGIYSELKTININPSLAFRPFSSLSVGFGLNFQMAEVTLSSAIDFGSLCYSLLLPGQCSALNLNPQANDGLVEFSGDDYTNPSVGYNFGLLQEFSNGTRVGLHVRSKIKHDLEGDADFSVPGEAAPLNAQGTFNDGAINAELNLPQTFSLSLLHQFRSKLAVMADLTLTDWSVFEEIRIKYEDGRSDSVTTQEWDDTYRFAIGANYEINSSWLFRAGLALDQTPVPSSERRSPRVPDSDRTWLSFGASYAFSKSLGFDIGFSHLFISKAEIDNKVESQAPTLQHQLTGSYSADVNILSAQMRWFF